MERTPTVTFLSWLSRFLKGPFHRRVCPDDQKVRVGGVFPLDVEKPPSVPMKAF